jgi:hypothetical protein
MSKAKTLIGAFVICGVGIAGGIWLGRWQMRKAWEQTYYLTLHSEVGDVIKTLDHLNKNEAEAANQRLEKRLNLIVMLAEPSSDRDPLRDDQKAILQLIGLHRQSHPYSDPNHPGMNKMVSSALERAK